MKKTPVNWYPLPTKGCTSVFECLPLDLWKEIRTLWLNNQPFGTRNYCCYTVQNLYEFEPYENKMVVMGRSRKEIEATSHPFVGYDAACPVCSVTPPICPIEATHFPFLIYRHVYEARGISNPTLYDVDFGKGSYIPVPGRYYLYTRSSVIDMFNYYLNKPGMSEFEGSNYFRFLNVYHIKYRVRKTVPCEYRKSLFTIVGQEDIKTINVAEIAQSVKAFGLKLEFY